MLMEMLSVSAKNNLRDFPGSRCPRPVWVRHVGVEDVWRATRKRRCGRLRTGSDEEEIFRSLTLHPSVKLTRSFVAPEFVSFGKNTVN